MTPPDLSPWSAGNTGTPYVHALDSGKPGPEVLLTALVHGNEISGAIVAADLLAGGWRPAHGRLTLAFCNIAAFARFDAGDPDASRFTDEDMNRVWSTQRLDGNEASAELLRARALRPFVDRCTHLLDLHSMHEPCQPLLVTGTLPRNIAFARRLRSAGQIVIDAGHADGVRMRDYAGGEAGAQRIALLFEAGHHLADASVTHARDIAARFLAAAGACGSEALPAGWLLPDAPATPPVEVTHKVVATSLDFHFMGSFSGGEIIAKAGTPIAMNSGEPVLTPYDDCVLVMPSVRQLRAGVTTVRLGRETQMA